MSRGLGCASCGGTCRDGLGFFRGLGFFLGMGDDTTDTTDTGGDIPIVTVGTADNPITFPGETSDFPVSGSGPSSTTYNPSPGYCSSLGLSFDSICNDCYDPSTQQPCSSLGGGSSPAGSSGSQNNALTNVESNLAAAWTKIAGQVIAPQTTITTPSGLQISTPSGQTSNLASVLQSAGGLNTTALGSEIGALLPWALIGVAGFMLISALGNRH